jgi:hypothetical protein
MHLLLDLLYKDHHKTRVQGFSYGIFTIVVKPGVIMAPSVGNRFDHGALPWVLFWITCVILEQQVPWTEPQLHLR